MNKQAPPEFFCGASGAFMKHPEAGFVLAQGPFSSHREPEGECCFYVNDFSLSDDFPWKKPASWVVVPESAFPETPPPLSIDWLALPPDSFSHVFGEMMKEIESGTLMKTVPALTEFGIMPQVDSWLSLLARSVNAPTSLIPYGFWEHNEGFCGATPEYLFIQREKRIETMALAGTARPEDKDVFSNDSKEIHEHEIVAGSLISLLSPYGSVSRTPRTILDLESLIHFFSRVTLVSDEIHPPDFWTRLLHPTPALGPSPKTEKSLHQLLEWRRRLRCPARFGAPFGLWVDGIFCSLVSIRGVHWKETSVALTSGCGVVKGSGLTHEWRELALKRRAIRQALRLD